MKRQLKPFVVERKRRRSAAEQPTSIWSDVMTPELRILAQKTNEPAAPADKDAGTEARPLQAPSNAQPAHRTGRILVSRLDPAPVRAEPEEPAFSQKPKPYRRRSSAHQASGNTIADVTAIPPETASIVMETLDARRSSTLVKVPVPSSDTLARLPYRVRRREATKGLKLEHRWKRGLTLQD